MGHAATFFQTGVIASFDNMFTLHSWKDAQYSLKRGPEIVWDGSPDESMTRIIQMKGAKDEATG